VLFPLAGRAGIALAAAPSPSRPGVGVATARGGAGLAVWSVCVVVLGAVERVWMAYAAS